MGAVIEWLAGALIMAAAGWLYFSWLDRGRPFDPRWIPTLLIGIDVCAAIGYGAAGGWTAWRKVAYWLAAAALSAVVTW